MRNRDRKVFGVGINDAAYETQKFIKVDGRSKLSWSCKLYKKWSGMMERCYGKSYQSKNPSYIGCTVCDDWIYFSKFKEWADNFQWEGLQLDKDILGGGEKIYCPENCAFILGKTNRFIITGRTLENGLMIGVNSYVTKGKYSAKCGNPFTGNQENLGIFNSELEAHLAWKKRKYELSLILADMEIDPRVKTALPAMYK